MAKTNAKHGVAADQFLQVRYHIGQGLRIAGAVRQPYAVRLESRYVFRGGMRRNDRDAATQRRHIAKAVALQPEVISGNVQPASGVFRAARGMKQARGAVGVRLRFDPLVRRFARHNRSQVESRHLRRLASSRDHCFFAFAQCAKAAAHRAAIAYMTHKRAGVYFGKTGDAVTFEVLIQ